MTFLKKAGGFVPAFFMALFAAIFMVCCLLLAAPCAKAAGLYEKPAGAYDNAAGLEGLFATQPVLQIVYSAQSGGELYPCASCSGQIGGLARRAGFINSLRQQGAPLLQIVGPGEFPVDAASQTEPPGMDEASGPGKVAEADASLKNEAGAAAKGQAARFLQIYAALRPQAVYLSAAGQGWLEAAQKPLPGYFVPLGQQGAVSRVLNYGGRKVGLVFFGAVAAPAGSASQELNPAFQAALAEGRKLAGQVHLLIGISPWGFEAERAFLPQAAGLYHILLGGGPGPSFAKANHSHSGQLLWSRPATKGTALTHLSLYRWPLAGEKPWVDGLSFEAALEFLGPERPTDPTMIRLLE